MVIGYCLLFMCVLLFIVNCSVRVSVSVSVRANFNVFSVNGIGNVLFDWAC